MKEERKTDPDRLQEQPHEGAWAGGWPRPGQKTWLGIERDKRTSRPPQASAPEAERSDRRLAREVGTAIGELEFDTGAVEVAAGGGHVRLGGVVASAAAQLACLRAAAAVPGVQGVHNQLVVSTER